MREKSICPKFCKCADLKFPSQAQYRAVSSRSNGQKGPGIYKYFDKNFQVDLMKPFGQSSGWPVLQVTVGVAINGPSWQASESRQANKTPELFLPSFPIWSALTANSRSLPVREDGKSCFVLTLVLWYLLWFQKILRIRAWKLTQGKDKDTGPRTVLPERASSHWELLRSDWEFIYATGQWVN